MTEYKEVSTDYRSMLKARRFGAMAFEAARGVLFLGMLAAIALLPERRRRA